MIGTAIYIVVCFYLNESIVFEKIPIKHFYEKRVYLEPIDDKYLGSFFIEFQTKNRSDENESFKLG